MKKVFKKYLMSVVLVLIVTQIGYSQSIEKFIDPTIKVDSLNVPTDSNQPYFPKKMFPEVETNWVYTDSVTIIETKVKEETYDEFVVNWYSKHLHAMKEPLLFNRKIKREIYRFTWLRTFHKPMTFRIEKSKYGCILFYKVLNGKGGYKPGKLEVERLKIVTEKEWDKFIELIKKVNFWEMEIGRSSIGNDGSEWILEGANQKNYRVVTLWSPNKGSYYDACNYLISLTNLKISKKNKY